MTTVAAVKISADPTLKLHPSLTITPTCFCCRATTPSRSTPVYLNKDKQVERFNDRKSSNFSNDYTKTLERIEEHLKELALSHDLNEEDILKEARTHRIIPKEEVKSPFTVYDITRVNMFAKAIADRTRKPTNFQELEEIDQL